MKTEIVSFKTLPGWSVSIATIDFSQVEQDASISESSPHIANIGRMVEDMENKIRSTLNEIYFGKTKDIGNGLRSIQSLDDQRQQAGMKQELAAALVRRNVRGDN